MNEHIENIEDNDKFWLYIGGVVLAIITTIVMVKHSENEKFAPIQQQLNEEAAQMNIRVLN
jgi:predicted thioesterase